MCTQIDMAVDAVCVGVPSFEEFSCLPGVTRGDHFGCVPIEAVVTVHSVRKHEGQGIASVDGQFMFIYAGPKLLTRMAYVSARSFCTWNAVKYFVCCSFTVRSLTLDNTSRREDADLRAMDMSNRFSCLNTLWLSLASETVFHKADRASIESE
ncbi:unnamed protein product [Schistocephalus solidus]|uniref:Uncharacterized protein n=1 Tax=Schistocephalus solidus TaxID=70667 RepID=A0A183T9Q3_SCHSO|nr:unnamed protein product [Schistocephalus solidus]